MLNGWEGLDTPIEQNLAVSEKDLLIFEVFKTKAGQRLIELLGEIETQPNMPTNCADGIMMAQLMAFNEGEKNFYRKLTRAIKKATKEGN